MATQFITISIEILHDTNLTPNEKFILAEIQQLSCLDKGCIASNQHFSELVGISKRTVSRCIKDLESKKYIQTEIVPGSRNHIRNISLDKMSNPPRQNVQTPMTKCLETKDNKTINKTTNYKKFISELKMRCNIPSKVTCTKEGEKLFNKIDDVDKLIADYVDYQADKKEFAIRITAFMEDYSHADKVSDDWSKYAR